MGALSALRNMGPALYGGVRAMQDADQEDMRREGFDADQAIRKERLDQERLDAPMRREARQLEIGQAKSAIERRKVTEPREDELNALNLRIAKLNVDDKEKLTAQAQTVREREKQMDSGVAALAFGGDPQPLAGAIAKLYPQFEGLTATRNDDGSITVVKPGGKPHTFNGKKFPDGKKMSPDDEFGMIAKGLLGPMKRLEEQTKQAEKLELEGVKTDRAIEVEDKRTDRATKVAEVKANKDEAKRLADSGEKAASHVEKNWKTKDFAGGMTLGFTDPEYAVLLPATKALASEYARSGIDSVEAANKAGQEVSVGFSKIKKQATAAATALNRKGEWKAAKEKDRWVIKDGAGKTLTDPDAQAMSRALAMSELIGKQMPEYLQSSLPKRKTQ